MKRVHAFQTLVVISALLYIVWMALPHLSRTFTPEVQNALAWSGYGGVSWVSDPLFFLSIGVGKFVASLGLFLLRSWGRWLLLAVVTVSLASVPFAGVSTGVPLDNIVGYFLSLTDGAILALAFFSPLAEAVRKDA